MQIIRRGTGRRGALMAACVALMLGGLAPSAQAQDSAVPRQIVVTGTGAVQTAPDMAVVTLGVTRRAPTAQAAMDAVSEDVRAVFRAVTDLGVAPRDVQTVTLRLDPVFSDPPGDGQGAPEIRGFVATNDVALRLRDMTTLGTVLQAVLDASGNRFSSIRFTLADPAPQQAEARRAAVRDAQARAALYAEAAGVTLGPVRSIVEGGARPQPMPGIRMAMDSAMPVAPGAMELTARVTVTYAIAD
jgi:uncharacterized protein YggE